VTRFDQRVDDVRTDEPGAAGHEHLHGAETVAPDFFADAGFPDAGFPDAGVTSGADVRDCPR
jgi:hypothetical protein